MPTFKLPLSGDGFRAFSPWTTFMPFIGNQSGSTSVAVGESSAPAVEADALSDVASYGKQLGRIGDALLVLLAHFHPTTPLTKEETAAIDDLKDMLQRIADVKDKHKRQALRPYVSDAPAPDQTKRVAAPASAKPAPVATSSDESPPPASRRSSRSSPRRSV